MAKVIYTAKANVTGGREHGHGVTDDGALDVQLRPPTEGGGTNPEQLFAVGYAACFEGAIGAVGRRERLEVGDVLDRVVASRWSRGRTARSRSRPSSTSRCRSSRSTTPSASSAPPTSSAPTRTPPAATSTSS